MYLKIKKYIFHSKNYRDLALTEYAVFKLCIGTDSKTKPRCMGIKKKGMVTCYCF